MLNSDPKCVPNTRLPESFKSNALKLFMELLEAPPKTTILDLGPVCGENIDFISKKVRKLYVHDFYRAVIKDLETGKRLNRAWDQLDYPHDVFSGILLWDIVDRLQNRDAAKLICRCGEMVKPRGYVVLFAADQDTGPGPVNSFVLGEEYTVSLRAQCHIRLPAAKRENRDIFELMQPFVPVKSFIHRNGLREFLFRA
ncbi:MAG: hypothetical protein R6U50_07100 [Desulfobacterales bacterium]